MLRIKEGVKLYPFGLHKDAEPLTSESKLSQDSLEYLKAKFPDDVEEIKESKQLKQK